MSVWTFLYPINFKHLLTILQSVAVTTRLRNYFCCVELQIKIYTDKASKIGIKYSYDYQAIKSYESLISKHYRESFSIRIEPVRQKVNIELQSDQTGQKVFYKDLIYRPDQLKKLNDSLTPGMLLDFVHVYPSANQMFIAKPYNKKEFIRISECVILQMEDSF